MKGLKLGRGCALLFGIWRAAAALAGRAAADTPAATLTKEQWRQDLQHLARELPRRHKNAFHAVTREQFLRAVAALDAAIPSLQDHEIRLGLQRIVAMVGDAHTALASSGWAG